MEDFIIKLAEILEVEKVEMNNVLTDFEEWDSLTSLSIIATIDADFNINISAEQLVSVSTVGELVKLINEKLKK